MYFQLPYFVSSFIYCAILLFSFITIYLKNTKHIRRILMGFKIMIWGYLLNVKSVPGLFLSDFHICMLPSPTPSVVVPLMPLWRRQNRLRNSVISKVWQAEKWPPPVPTTSLLKPWRLRICYMTKRISQK